MKIVYIDSQNVHKATMECGRKIDWQRFFIYLRDNDKIDTFYYTTGYRPEFILFYEQLQKVGYTMLYKETTKLPDGTIKGNVDIDIAIRAIFDVCERGLSKAYLVTNDGDYNTLVDIFKERGVLGIVIVPNHLKTSRLLKKSAGRNIQYIHRIKHLIEKQKNPNH